MSEPSTEIREVEVTYPVYDNVPIGPGSAPPQMVVNHWNIGIDQVDQSERERRLLREPMEQILANCADYPPMSHEQSLELLEQARAGDKEARRDLILHFQRFVIYHAKQKFPQARRLNVPMEDVVQDGMVGLVCASDKLDPAKTQNNPGAMPKYLSYGISRDMQRGIAGKSRLIHLPVNIHDQARSLAAISSALRDELGREPTDFEIAERAGMMPPKPTELIGVDESKEYDEFTGRHPEYAVNRARSEHAKARHKAAEKVTSILSTERPMKSLDGYVRDNAGDVRPLHEVVGDEDSELAIVQNAFESLRRDSIAEALDLLTEREQTVVELRNGLDGDEPRTLDETGAILGVTRERIRQIEKNILKKLQTMSNLRSDSSEELEHQATHRPSRRTYIDHVGELISAQREKRDTSWLEREANVVALQRVTHLRREIAKRKKDIADANVKKNLYTLAEDYLVRTENGGMDIDSSENETKFIQTYQRRYQDPQPSREELERRSFLNKKVTREYSGLIAFTALSYKPATMSHLHAWKIARRTFLDTLRNFENDGQRLTDVYNQNALEAFSATASGT